MLDLLRKIVETAQERGTGPADHTFWIIPDEIMQEARNLVGAMNGPKTYAAPGNIL